MLERTVVFVAADVIITGTVGELAVTGIVVCVGTDADTGVVVEINVADVVGVVESLLVD